jgi:RHS repeat-associated protein
VALQTANLIARNQAIRYDYDFTRLTAAHYPEVREPDDDRAGRLKDDSGGENGDGRPGEDVTFEYGGPGAPDNGAGRLVRITDPSGIERRAYGKLGEVVRQDRTFAGGGDDDGPPPTYTTQYRYDTWGRLIGLVYPDGEALAYEYDAGGLVRRAVGSDRGRTYEYLRRLEYDRFRKQAYLEMGNGVRTTFEYRPDDQRLSRLRSVSAAGEFQDLRYTYDPVGNLTSLANDVPAPTRSEGGGPTVQRFEYDELYRLVGASGAYQFAPRKSSVYTLALRYDAIHNILEKRQTHDVVDASGHRARQRGTTYDAVYGYSAARPHAPARVGELDVTYDANGNQTGLTEDRHDDRRRIVWDDENRIRSVSIHGKKTRFAYDASGARVLKAGSDGAVAYVNQFFTVRNGEVFTHHVYVGGTRLASRIVEPPDSKGERDADEDVVYFYHPDQLGSTQFVTDARGAVTQHLEYFPFGEIWVNEMEGEEQTDLGFSGQELDPETGLYYFGARYQDPRLAQFLSVDPASARDGDELAASGPAALNAYAFAFDNPVRLVDATGLDPGWWSEQNQTFGQFQGAVGHSVAGARAPPATSKVFGATDSPVRAATATGAGDFVAGAGVGVIATAPPPTSQVATARERANAVIAPPRGIRGPPADAAAPAQTRTPSNVGEGAAASLDTRPPVVLGENMDGRVSPYAKSIGAETIVHWLAGRPWTRPLNVEFIAHIRAEGRKAIDIGPDFPRRLRERGKPQQFRPVYPEERMQMRGYANYRQVYVRTGKYEGGVPGLDFPGAAGGGAAGAQP